MPAGSCRVAESAGALHDGDRVVLVVSVGEDDDDLGHTVESFCAAGSSSPCTSAFARCNFGFLVLFTP